MPPPKHLPFLPSWPGRGCDPAKAARIGVVTDRSGNRSSPSVRPPSLGPQTPRVPPSLINPSLWITSLHTPPPQIAVFRGRIKARPDYALRTRRDVDFLRSRRAESHPPTV
jgi:hypothetical protein